jgi:hypothetical protein
MCTEMGVLKMKFKKMISLVTVVAFVAAFAVCPAFAGPEENGAYVAPQKRQGPVSGTLDYLGSVVDVASKGAWEQVDSAKSLVPRCCGERIIYRPRAFMNRGSRWGRMYKH